MIRDADALSYARLPPADSALLPQVEAMSRETIYRQNRDDNI